MANQLKGIFRTSIFRKQIVAVTGMAMVFFVVAHLAGNFLLFSGPEKFNHYAEMLVSLGEVLWIMRLGLITALALHVYFTILLVMENRAAREGRYAVQSDFGETSFAKKTMILSGLLVFFFLLLHLYNFTLGDKVGEASYIYADNGELVLFNGEKSHGLYGLVWMTFANPMYALIYVVSVSCVGMHLSHGIQSIFQTCGVYHERYMPRIRTLSAVAGLLVGLGFSLIPIYVLIRHHLIGFGA